MLPVAGRLPQLAVVDVGAHHLLETPPPVLALPETPQPLRAGASAATTALLFLTALLHTHAYELNQGVVDEGSLRQEEAAART